MLGGAGARAGVPALARAPRAMREAASESRARGLLRWTLSCGCQPGRHCPAVSTPKTAEAFRVLARGWHPKHPGVNMKLMSIAAMALSMPMMALAGTASQDVNGQDQKVTITGCAVKGTGDGDGFLLANGADMKARVLYWLDDDDDEVQKFIGQLVEVTGEVEGDVKRGEIEVERENGMIELEIKAGDRKATVKLADVPSAIGTSGAVKDRETELPYLVRKLDVKSAKSIAPSCQ